MFARTLRTTSKIFTSRIRSNNPVILKSKHRKKNKLKKNISFITNARFLNNTYVF